MSNLWRIGAFAAGLVLIAAASIIAIFRTPEAQVTLPAPDKQVEILVAAQKLDSGTLLTADKIQWRLISETRVTSSEIIRSGNDSNIDTFLGRMIVDTVQKDQPILPSHFERSGNSNSVAGLLPRGKRAFAISIDSKGTASAGNLILPNDRVDVIRSFNSATGLQSELILADIRILAIGQTMQGDGVSSVGDTATVEVDLQGAQLLATAQRTGQLSLALRSPLDSAVETHPRPAIQVIRSSRSDDKQP